MPRRTAAEKLLPPNAKSIGKAIRSVVDSEAINEFRIQGQRGLVLLVTASGTATWYFYYDAKEGKKRSRRKHRIGRIDEVSLSEALSKAEELRPEINRGSDPVARQAHVRRAMTFGELAEERLSKGATLREATLYDYRLVLERDIFPFLRHLPLEDVSRDRVLEVIDEVAERGASRRADTARAIMSSIFSYGLDRGIVTVNPAIGIKPRHDYRPRDVVAKAEQIRALWVAMDEGIAPMDEVTADVIRLALLTGQRRSELARTRVCEVTLTPGAELLEFSRDRTKNDNPHFVPLNRLAVDVALRAVDRAKQGEFLFPGSMSSACVSPRSVSKAMERTRVQLGLGDITVHDLRRTVGSYLASFGVPLEVRKKVFNHSSSRTGDVTSDVYSWYAYDPEKRAALELWGDAVASLLEGKPREIDGYDIRLARLKGKQTVRV